MTASTITTTSAAIEPIEFAPVGAFPGFIHSRRAALFANADVVDEEGNNDGINDVVVVQVESPIPPSPGNAEAPATYRVMVTDGKTGETSVNISLSSPTWYGASVPPPKTSGRGLGHFGQTASASAAIGSIANTSASGETYATSLTYDHDADPQTPPQVVAYPSSTSVTLIITDVTEDGFEDITITMTHPPLGPSAASPFGHPAKYAVFILNAHDFDPQQPATATIANVVFSAPGI